MFNAKATGLRSTALGILQILTCTILLLVIPTETSSQVSKNQTSGPRQLSDSPETTNNGNVTLENARVMLLTENIRGAVIIYSALLAKDSLNVSLNSEYAYALALNGIYEAALSRLDRVWKIRGTNSDPVYFASQIFTLMGFYQLSEDIYAGQTKNNSPVWVASKAAVLNKKFGRDPEKGIPLTGDQTVEDFKLANRLTARGMDIQAIGLFEEIIRCFPQEYLPYVGLSIPLEKAGIYTRAAWALETSLKIVGEDPSKAETRQSLDRRLALVKSKTTKTPVRGNTAIQPALVPSRSNSLMLYAGGMISSAFTSVNTRIGYFTSDNTNAAIDFGLSSMSNTTSFSLGLSYFQRHKIFVAGFGLAGSFGNDSKALYGKVSVGLSLINKRNKASWDIFMDGQAPFNKDQATIIGMSFGRSLYFGTRK